MKTVAGNPQAHEVLRRRDDREKHSTHSVSPRTNVQQYKITRAEGVCSAQYIRSMIATLFAAG